MPLLHETAVSAVKSHVVNHSLKLNKYHIYSNLESRDYQTYLVNYETLKTIDWFCHSYLLNNT